MCNRYRTARDIETLRTIYRNAPDNWFDDSDKKYDTVYKNANVPVYLRVQGEEMFSNFTWGFVPPWAKKKSDILTNSRDDNLMKNATWIDSFRRRRCLLPAEAFYEPATVDGKKYQMKFTLRSGEPFSIAGLWAKTEMFGPKRNCCSLITTEPNELVAPIHGRMPVILPQRYYDLYLDTPPEEAERLLEILQPYPADEMIGTFDSEST